MTEVLHFVLEKLAFLELERDTRVALEFKDVIHLLENVLGLLG